MRLKYISIYRVVAMMSILACHIAQSQGCALMGVLNCNGGVMRFCCSQDCSLAEEM